MRRGGAARAAAAVHERAARVCLGVRSSAAAAGQAVVLEHRPLTTGRARLPRLAGLRCATAWPALSRA